MPHQSVCVVEPLTYTCTVLPTPLAPDYTMNNFLGTAQYTSIKKQLNKIEGWSRDGSAKKYTNKVCSDNVSHPLYISTLAFLDN